MAFAFVKNPRSAYDPETGTEIKKKAGFRDGVYTFDYIFKQGELEFVFEVLPTDVPYTYITTKDSDITGLPKGSEVTGLVGDAAYIMERDFRRKLSEAFHKVGKPAPDESDYEFYKKLICDGFSALATDGGDTVNLIPGGKFRVEFEDDEAAVAAKYPGKIRGYISPVKTNPNV